jgi:predicted HicB family RNase H-like nuclease
LKEIFDDIEKHFQEAVDDYLDFCERNNKAPEKEYSGNFNIRIAPETHKKLKLEAERSNKTLNSIIANALDDYANNKSDISPSATSQRRNEIKYTAAISRVSES